MKNLILSFILIMLGTFSLIAQITPQSFNYQGVARDNGIVVTGGIGLQISIRSGSINGAVVYQERQFPTTNDYGVFSVEVGGFSAVVTQGDFEAIDWSTGEYFMQVGLDPNGGASFNDMGTTQLASVPFALFAESARTAIDDNDTDPTNEIQGLILNGTNLEIENGNMVDLAPIISQGDDDQSLILSGTNLSIENGNSVDLSIIQDGVTDADADPNNEIQDLTLTLTGTVLSIEDGNAIDLGPVIPPGGTDDQNLSLSGNTLSIEGGNSVDLSVVQDGTQDADADPNNEIQTLSLSGTSLSIQDGNTVDLSIVQDGVNDADADPANELQDLTLTGTVIQIENGNSIDLAPVIPPGGTDDQNLMLSGTSLTIEDGNTIDLAPIIPPGGTDDQNLTLNGNSLTIEDGNTVILNVNDADADPTNEYQNLTLNGTMIQIENGNSIDLAPIIPPGGTDDQNLTLNGTNLTIEDGNTIDLAPIIPPGGTDDQNLILNGSNLEIEDGNNVDMSSFLDNTDEQDLSLIGNTLSLTNDASSVDLSGYLDNTDAQDLSLSGNNLNLTNDATPVDLSNYLDNTDAQNLANVLGQGNSANSKITNLTNPTADQDAATKSYVDGQIGTVPNDLIKDGDDDTKIQVEENNDEDKIRFDLMGTEKMVLTRNPNENLLIDIPNNEGHVFIGSGAGANNNSFGEANTFIGNHAGYSNNNGDSNTFIGDEAGNANTLGYENTFIGEDAGKMNDFGYENTFIGNDAGATNQSGEHNTFIGSFAGKSNDFGHRNTYIGRDAGYNSTGSGNVFLGEKAGFGETGDNKLHIGTGVSSSPLIWGDFFNEILSFNARVGVGFDNPFSALEVRGKAGDQYVFHTQDPNSLGLFSVQGDGNVYVWNKLGIGGVFSTPINELDIGGGMVVGLAYAGNNTAPQNGVLVEGNVGIGTITPVNKLTVQGTWTEPSIPGNSSTGTARIAVNNNEGIDIGKKESPTFAGWIQVGYNGTTADPLNLQPLGGGVGIGMDPMNNDLEVNGTASKSSGGEWLANSDARLKKNIQPLSSAAILEKILSLRGVNYEWNDTKTGYERPLGIQYGFTAQNIQQVFPELVTEDNLGYLQTSYGTYDAMYVEAFRELNNKIERQEEEIEQLHSQLEEMNNLKSRLSKLEAVLLSTENTAMTEKEK